MLNFASVRQTSPSMGRVLATKTFVHLIDAKADAAYSERRDLTLVAAVELAGLSRTLLVVPLLDGDGLARGFLPRPPGSSGIHRQTNRPSRQISPRRP